MGIFIRSGRQMIERHDSGNAPHEDRREVRIPISTFKNDPQDWVNLPEHFDLRDHYDFPPVGEQTNVCGACLPFAVVNAIELGLFKKYGKEFPRLSVQALIDCSWMQVIYCLKKYSFMDS